MSADVTVNVDEQARTLAGLLKEYSTKLAALNERAIPFVLNHYQGTPYFTAVAWWLDECESIRRPLLRIIERASGLHEHAQLDSLLDDELALRLTETEAQLHHVIRHALQLHDLIDRHRIGEQVAQMRLTAGLPGLKTAGRL